MDQPFSAPTTPRPTLLHNYRLVGGLGAALFVLFLFISALVGGRLAAGLGSITAIIVVMLFLALTMMLTAKMLGGQNRSAVKAFSYVGYYFGLVAVQILILLLLASLGLGQNVLSVVRIFLAIGVLWLMIKFLQDLYSISGWRSFGLILVHGIISGVVMLIFFFTVGAGLIWGLWQLLR